MNLDRFQPPNASDDLATCARCGQRVYYGRLNDDQLCGACANDYEKQDEEKETKPSRKRRQPLR